MKKAASIIVALCLSVLMFSGCSETTSTPQDDTNGTSSGTVTFSSDDENAESNEDSATTPNEETTAPDESTNPPNEETNESGESTTPSADDESTAPDEGTSSPDEETNEPDESTTPPSGNESTAPDEGTSSPDEETDTPPVEKTSITTNGGAVVELSSLEYQNADASSTVYYISDITPEALVAVYEKLGWSPSGNVGIKLSTGEPPASNYLDPNLIKNLVQMVDGTIVECNTAYGGSRASTARHYQVAEDHGYTVIAPVQILDEDGSMTLPVTGGLRLSENYVGAAFDDYDSYIVLSHFKGHSMAGFGGAIKNISIGFGSGSSGKAHIHSGGTGGGLWGGEQIAFTEAMADAGKSVSDYMGNGEQIIYINVMNNLSIDCDCNGHPAEPDIHDIGILASTDPVALDQACIDLIWVSEGNSSFVNRVNNRQGIHTLESGEQIGLGSREYNLLDIGDESNLGISNYVAGGTISNNETGGIDSVWISSILVAVVIGIGITVFVIGRKKKRHSLKQNAANFV